MMQKNLFTTPMVALALVACAFAQAQEQSGCPGPRQPVPTSSCGPGEVNRNITVRVVKLSSGDSVVSAETMTETVARVEEHQYRRCDMGMEIIDRVKDSFQRLGFFCADVGHIAVQQTSKTQFDLHIQVHPGEQYRVGEVNFSGSTLFSAEELQSALRIKPNSVFSTESVRRGIGNIEKSYAKKGHLNVAALPVVSVDQHNKRIALEIKIRESGPSR
jgi:outer membrane protein assembly factor BamA